jgi:hypothetical protein
VYQLLEAGQQSNNASDKTAILKNEKYKYDYYLNFRVTEMTGKAGTTGGSNDWRAEMTV